MAKARMIEIVPREITTLVTDNLQTSKKTVKLTKDEGNVPTRRWKAGLSKLQPVMALSRITAGNASQLSDGVGR